MPRWNGGSEKPFSGRMSGRSYLCTCPQASLLSEKENRICRYACWSLTGNKNYLALTKLTNTIHCNIMQHLDMRDLNPGPLGEQASGKPTEVYLAERDT